MSENRLDLLHYEKVYQPFFYPPKLILVSVEIAALALSYHILNGLRHLLTDLDKATCRVKLEVEQSSDPEHIDWEGYDSSEP